MYSQPYGKSEKSQGNKHKVIYIGRLTETKGVVALCQAHIPSTIDLIFIGSEETADAPSIQALQQKVSAEKNVFYIGPLFGADKI